MPRDSMNLSCARYLLWVCLMLATLALVRLFQRVPVVRAATIAVQSSADGAARTALPSTTLITVTTTIDEQNTNSMCSLREAILNANGNNQSGSMDCPAGTGSDTITFNISGTIVLSPTLGGLAITDNLTINGPSAGFLTISGNNAIKVLTVSGVTLNLSGVTVANGFSTYGGGIYNTGMLIVTNSTFSGNGAFYDGGGIYNTGVLTVTNSTFSGNSAPYLQSEASNGGGIYNASVLTVTNTTFYSNMANSQGGGIYNHGTLNITNSTLSGNSASNGGGIGEYGCCGSFTFLWNTIVANSPSGSNCSGAGTILDGGNNLQFGGTFTNSCGVTIPTADPKLGPLANNGGATLTMELLRGSAAIDAGSNAFCPPTDQRGFHRPVDGDGNGTATCDIGAYEAPFNLFLPIILK